MINISDFIADWDNSLFHVTNLTPWEVTARAPELIEAAFANLEFGYTIEEEVAVHETAEIEIGAIIKGPAVIGPGTFVASGAYLRGGVFLDTNCIVGPACELKSTFMFTESKIAHLSFVGDSIIGARTNVEAGAIIANYRNEMDDKLIRIARNGRIIETGVDKFGALVGDDVRIGANAVIAPGAIIDRGYKLTRLGKIDQHPQPLT